jgi:WD40 repeat protein
VLTPNGEKAITGSEDGTVRFWRLNVPELKPYDLIGHSGLVSAACITSNALYALTGSWDTTAILWDLSHFEEIPKFYKLEGHADCVTAVALAPSGDWAVTGSSDSTVRLWNCRDKKNITYRLLLGHTSSVNSVSISWNSCWVIAGSYDQVIAWDVRDLGNIRSYELKGIKGLVHSVAISPDGSYALVGSGNQSIEFQVWNVFDPDFKFREPRCVFSSTLQGHTGPINSLAMASNNLYAISSSRDKKALLWNMSPLADFIFSMGKKEGHKRGKDRLSGLPKNAKRYLKEWLCHEYSQFLKVALPSYFYELIDDSGYGLGKIRSIAISNESERIVTVSDDAVKVWDCIDLRNIKSTVLLTLSKSVVSASLNSWGDSLITEANDNSLTVWDCNNLDNSINLNLPLLPSASILGSLLYSGSIPAATPNGRWILTKDSTKAVVTRWNRVFLSGPFSDVTSIDLESMPLSGCLTPDGKLALIGLADGSVKAYHFERSTSIVLNKHENGVRFVGIADDGKSALTSDGVVVSYVTIENRSVYQLEKKHKNPIKFLSISSDGTRALTADEKVVRVWDLREKRSYKLKGHRDAVTDALLSADGRWVVTASNNGIVQQWDIKDLKEIDSCKLCGQTGTAPKIAMTSDSSWVVISSEGIATKLLSLHPSAFSLRDLLRIIFEKRNGLLRVTTKNEALLTIEKHQKEG